MDGGNDIALSISFPEEWEAKFNRPILPLWSLPVPLYTRKGRKPALNGPCNVRRLSFFVKEQGAIAQVGENNDVKRDQIDMPALEGNRETVAQTIVVEAVESTLMGGYFGMVWDCGLGLASYLASGPSMVAGRRVVELGAGAGVVSTVCAALGAAEVVATDLHDVLPLLRFNVRRNCPGWKNIQVM
ncbi:unnamed protein product [Choristocarpus tenellus]